jgi:hypothetical protein
LLENKHKTYKLIKKMILIFKSNDKVIKTQDENSLKAKRNKNTK